MKRVEIEDQPGLEKVKQLLRDNGLPWQDVQLSGNFFIGYSNDEGELIASGGLEIYGDYVLLRSVAVKESARGQRLGHRIVNDLLGQASGKSVFLLTETATGFFTRFGFSEVSRDQVPDPIRKSSEFSSVCPVSAICMVLPAER
ncbi:MAG: arsenic resistance N-acetyltransferase ArsN2 [Cyclobacteriaceae bacterium]|jgi:amino-acid N-acetyltransferase